MKSKKLDKRHKGYSQFKYSVDFSWREKTKFCEVRNWCWEQWGPSCEINIAEELAEKPNWCWLFDDWRCRIYFISEKEYQWFILKWQS